MKLPGCASPHARRDSRRWQSRNGTLPLSFAASLLTVPRRRSQALADHNRGLLAEPYDVDVVSPLLEPDFVRAMSDDGGLLGRGDRTAVMRLLASDLLPDAVIARTTKASFGGTYWGWQTREFADAWSGRGVDTDLVDPDVLRKLWRSDTHNPLSSALIQAAWLADHHVPRATAAVHLRFWLAVERFPRHTTAYLQAEEGSPSLGRWSS